MNAQVRYCPHCGLDYPCQQETCTRCGRVLVDKTLRVPAEEV